MSLRKNDRSGISKNSLIFGAVLWTAVFACVGVLWQNRQSPKPVVSSEVAEPLRDGNSADTPIQPGASNASVNLSFPARTLPDFQFDECMGGKFGLADLKGKPWVASFVFTRCTSTCPMITASMMRLHDRVKERNTDVMFLTITVDPKFDTAEILKTYSETFQPDRDRWKFLTGSQQEIFELVVNGFGLYVKENLGEARLPGFEVAHSNRVVLVNEESLPVGTFLATRDEDMVKLRRILVGTDDFPMPGPALSFSTSDGSPLQLQFEVNPVNPDTGKPESDAVGSDPPPSTDSDEALEKSAAKTEDRKAVVPAGGDEESEQNLNSDHSTLTSGPSAPADLSAAEHNALIDAKMPAWSKSLPAINASLNTLAGTLLLFGFLAIKNDKRTIHRYLMISAFITSVAFLGCYLIYHQQLGEHTGLHGKKFPGSGLAANIYPLVLVPHVILAAFVPFMAIRVFQHAFAGRWHAHKRLARITFPIWMYVSVTGVVIYGMLYHWPWPATVPSNAG